MEQYIPKSALMKQTEKCISKYKDLLNKIDKSNDDWETSALMLESKIDILQHILFFIYNLEWKEIDLLEDISNQYQDYEEYLTYEEFADIAKHFFEIGLKTQK